MRYLDKNVFGQGQKGSKCDKETPSLKLLEKKIREEDDLGISFLQNKEKTWRIQVLRIYIEKSMVHEVSCAHMPLRPSDNHIAIAVIITRTQTKTGLFRACKTSNGPHIGHMKQQKNT